MNEIFQFLTQLDQNNNKEWFDAHRADYERTREQFLHLTEILIHEIRQFDPAIGFLQPKDCMFRIYRDVRFSNDKRPFKNNYGSFMARNGRKSGMPGYYIHFQPGQSFIAGGMYMPPAPYLKQIRKAIFDQPQDFIDIIEDPQFKSVFHLFDDDKLKTAPQGFPKDFEHIDLLRYKSYSPSLLVPDEKLSEGKVIEYIVDKFERMAEFNQFLNAVIDQEL
jgi:uncharacterized protein (TIGR02453 family)